MRRQHRSADRSVRCLGERRTDEVYGNDGAGLVNGWQLERSSRPPQLSGFHGPVEPPPMACLERGRHDEIELVPDRFVGRIPEHRLTLGVPTADHTGPIGGQCSLVAFLPGGIVLHRNNVSLDYQSAHRSAMTRSQIGQSVRTHQDAGGSQ
jgi:hypothetical protein